MKRPKTRAIAAAPLKIDLGCGPNKLMPDTNSAADVDLDTRRRWMVTVDAYGFSEHGFDMGGLTPEDMQALIDVMNARIAQRKQSAE